MTERKSLNSQLTNDKQQINGDAVQNGRKKKLGSPIKNFTERNSVLTDLMEVTHFQSVYHMNVAVLGFLVMTLIMYYLADLDVFLEDFRMMMWASRQIHISAATWICLNILCCIGYRIVCIWAAKRQKQRSKILDFFLFLSLISICSLMFIMTPYIVLKADLGLITSFALLCEQVRMFMKIYSFVIENYIKMKRMDEDKDDDGKKFVIPTFSHFIYFMFAPTLIYRDSYPRAKDRNWGKVFNHFFNVVASVFIVYCLVAVYCVKVFKHIGLRTFTGQELVLMYVGCTVSGSIMMFLLFYTILHSWQNGFAEMLKFGDRLFYKDWWNSKSFSQYYRNWNAVVYEWIYTYIYAYLQNIGLNKHVAMLTVLFASSTLHDYIICLALGYFFPALGFVYSTMGFVFLLMTYNRSSQYWNIFVWFTLFSGWGCLIFAFPMEYYARKNCPSDLEGFWQYVIPRSFSCQLLATT